MPALLRSRADSLAARRFTPWCAALASLHLKQIIPPNEFVVTVVAPVRAADTVYDARLIPLLLHEDFSAYPVGTVALGPAGTIGDLTVIDQGSTSWTVAVGSPLEGAPPTWQPTTSRRQPHLELATLSYRLSDTCPAHHIVGRCWPLVPKKNV